MGKRAKGRFGLGRNLQGEKREISVAHKQDRYGLGYKPSSHERRRQMEKQREKNNDKPMTFPPLYRTFKSSGHINPTLFVEYRDAVVAFFTLVST